MSKKTGPMGALAALLLCLAMSCGSGEGTWITLTGETEETLPRTVCDYTGEIRMTFLGDCTLGGEEKSRNASLGFNRRVRDNGLDFPLRNLKSLTEGDQLTVANLEGVLSDRKLKKEKKKYNFIGPASYAGILSAGSVECVTLANNHSHDYGEEGYQDTKEALAAEGICWFGTDAPALWRSPEGLLIGFLGVNYSMTGNRYKQYAARMEQLRSLGCAAVITVMHAGEEYSYHPPSSYQKQIVERAVKCGTDLIIGHHPHVVQGYDTAEGIPVVYSLGNCSFGGTTRAKDSDALAVQAVMRFEDGQLTETELHFYPISITSDGHYNNYSPMLLTDADAERVLKKMKDSTGRDPGAWREGEGAVTVFPRK